MRIEALSTLVAVVWLTAVLCPRLAAANNLTLASSTPGPGEHPYSEHTSDWQPEVHTRNKRMTYRELNAILREEGGSRGFPVDCCPVVEEMVEPLGGPNPNNMFVYLYRDGENVQRFYEYSCRPDVLNKPCRFVDRKFSNYSKCVQRFSYTYAIVHSSEWKEHGRHHHKEHQQTFPTFSGGTVGGSGWTLDYIKVRSGCSCEITPPKANKRKTTGNKTKKGRSRHRQGRDHEMDFET